MERLRQDSPDRVEGRTHEKCGCQACSATGTAGPPPGGWNTHLGHKRKLKSYQVETTWQDTYSKYSGARLPDCLAIAKQDKEVLMVLEDLDEAGYFLRKSSVSWEELAACLQWLAQFHASYLSRAPDGLWKTGTYWHLATRPQELEALDDQALKEAAPSSTKS